MMKEVKISLPFYKTASALLFIVILSLIRGVSVSYEIGAAMEPITYVSLCVSVFVCAYICVLEAHAYRNQRLSLDIVP